VNRLIAATLFLICATCLAQTAKLDQAENVSWPSMVCRDQPLVCAKFEGKGYLFTKTGLKTVVMISHGSQGIDGRILDYVDSLQAAGFAALVIDHWTPRGIDVTHNDYPAAALKGGNDFNMAIDSLTAASWLRDRGYQKVGSIGESQGGLAAITMQQRRMQMFVRETARKQYGNPLFIITSVDAVISMYGHCGFRNAQRDAYADTPFLFITGELDDETPSKYCERYVPWMNERGGNAKIVVLKGEGHSFDAPYKYRAGPPQGQHFGRCDLLIDRNGGTNLNTGETEAGDNMDRIKDVMTKKCVGYYQAHSGHQRDRFVAVPHWIAFFKENL